ncbi:hypothetical protein CANARDRAFT_20708 [[Candida] arabinofermentans NRRL YB-2248]|uniref:Uncharacterized protein n=1 Tax=[Candida] arabinofermentans NRRL YB-2248 TaxID=983967 RepID=A0A1E4T8B2_9ASCO|nr:hypothetical protein CANARDRAFT_20708 [[Candida] arabinofermentans NRRL YB-2248]
MFNKQEERKAKQKIHKRQKQQNISTKINSIIERYHTSTNLKRKINQIESRENLTISDKKYLETLKSNYILLKNHEDKNKPTSIAKDEQLPKVQTQIQREPRTTKEPKKLYTKSIYYDPELNPLGITPSNPIDETINLPDLLKPTNENKGGTIIIKSNINEPDSIIWPDEDMPKFFKIRDTKLKTTYSGTGTVNQPTVLLPLPPSNASAARFVPRVLMGMKKKVTMPVPVPVPVPVDEVDEVSEQDQFANMAEEEEEYWKERNEK